MSRLVEFVETLISIQPTDDLMRTLTLSRLQDTTNSTGLQDLTQAPVDKAIAGSVNILGETVYILSEESVALPDPVDVLAGAEVSSLHFPLLRRILLVPPSTFVVPKENSVDRLWLPGKLSRKVQSMSLHHAR